MATFDYTSRDFVSIRQDLINRASRIIPEWSGDDASEFANMFVDLWAYMGDILHFYIDRAASETFLATATQRESVIALANLLDYKPASARSARGTVTVKINSVPTNQNTYSIPQYTVFTGYDSEKNAYKYYLSSALSSASVGEQRTGSLVQGEIITGESLGKSTGAINQSVILTKTNVDNDSISVYVYEGPVVDGVATAVQYLYAEHISSAGAVDKVFTTITTSDGYTKIKFGNGFNGAVPSTSAEITASYRTTDGEMGNLPANSITVVSGDASTYVTILSSSQMSGGSDVESMASIKTNVSRLYRTQDRAVSLQDYKDLTLQISGVSKATAVYAGGSGSASCNGASVTIYPAPHQSSYPPEPTSGSVIIEIPNSITESIETYFSTRAMAGVTATVVNPANIGSVDRYIECTPVYVGMTVHLLPTYVQSWVKTEVDAAIRSILSFDNVSFGQILSAGQVYRAALSVAGVDYVTLTNMSTTYTIGTGTTTNVVADSYKLLCFSDKVGTPPKAAITLTMVGGLTGSN